MVHGGNSISVVIPVYNCEKSIKKVVDEAIIELGKLDRIEDFNIVLVNDFSKDNSLNVCKEISRTNPNVSVISFSKNFGQHNALIAGLTQVKGDYVICMDDDLQTHPSEIRKLLNELITCDYDVVYAKYSSKQHSYLRNVASDANDIMAKWLINEPKHIKVTSFFIAKKFVVDEVIKYQNPYPYLSGLIFRVTQNIGSVEVVHYKRNLGKSNYSFAKLILLSLNGFTNFSIKPLRIASLSGFIFAFASFLVSLLLVIKKLMDPNLQVGWTSIMLVCIFFGGLQLMSIGLLGEYIGRIYLSINGTPQYVIKETYNMPVRESDNV